MTHRKIIEGILWAMPAAKESHTSAGWEIIIVSHLERSLVFGGARGSPLFNGTGGVAHQPEFEYFLDFHEKKGSV